MDMKINYLIFWMLFLGVAGCSPSEYKFMENGYISFLLTALPRLI